MSRYSNNQYTNYYDPVGSQSHQPSGYTYRSTTSAAPSYSRPATTAAYASNDPSYQNSNTAYSLQQYGSTGGQQTENSTNRAASPLSSLGNSQYSQNTATNRSTSSTGHYDHTAWYSSNSPSNNYNSSNLAFPDRSQSNASPLYANVQPTSSLGQMSASSQTQDSSRTYGRSSDYQNAPSNAGAGSRYTGYSTAAQEPPQRYASPLHATRAQQQSGHNKRPSTSMHQPSPHMAQAVRSAEQNAPRQQSESVEPSPTTVDPSQVYDNRAELQRKAQIEAEKRRKHEAEQAEMRAEEERLAAEKRKEEEERQRVEAEAAAKKAEAERKKEEKRKAREEKKQSKSAATTLQQMASLGTETSAAPGPVNEEEEMRAMFKKMREFNAKNPAMLAKLWEEERKAHSASTQSPQPSKAAPAPAAKETQKSAPPATPPAVTGSTAAESQKLRPFQQQKAPVKPPKAPASIASQTPQPASPSQAPLLGPALAAPNSLWPAHKKGALAEVAAKWLLSLPQNAGETVNRDSVLAILDTNPSYVQLCEKLEELGVNFERSALARELLRAVPDGLRPPAPPAPAKPANGVPATNGAIAQINSAAKATETSKGKGKAIKNEASSMSKPSTPSGPGIANYEAPPSLSDVAREVDNMGRIPAANDYRSPYFVQPPNVAEGSRAPSKSQPPEVKADIRPEEPPRPPADKEEAARKRTFGELVDLTAEDSDDEGPPKKTPHFAIPTNVVPSRRPIEAGTQHFQQPMNYQQYMFKQNTTPLPLASLPSQTKRPPMDQQLPTMPPAQPIKPKGPTPEQLQTARMRGKMLVEPIMRDRVMRRSGYDSRTIARDVLLATGRHPDMRTLNAHLVPMQRLLGQHGGELDGESKGYRCDLATVRWDVIDPEPPKQEGETAVNTNGGATGDIEDSGISASTLKQPFTNGHAVAAYDAPALAAAPKQPKRRGRPPRSSLPNQAKLTQGLGTSDFNAGTPNSSRPSTPASAPAPSAADDMAAAGMPVGYSTFQQFKSDGTKKKGRPFGWRKDIHSRAAQGLPSSTKKPKETDERRTPVSPSTAIVQPVYQIYKCEWAGCGAEIHNLETLRKHIVKVHGKASEDEQGQDNFQCWWVGCLAQTGQGNNGPAGSVATFPSIEGWVGHVEQEHLQPIAWKLGDGPKAGTVSPATSTAVPAYLSDSRGRSVTPIISPPAPRDPNSSTAETISASHHSSSFPISSTPLPKRIGRPPKDFSDGNSIANDAVASLRRLEEQRRIVGAALDRQGCVLADEGRRGDFMGDGEDFEDEVEGSEHEAGEW